MKARTFYWVCQVTVVENEAAIGGWEVKSNDNTPLTEADKQEIAKGIESMLKDFTK